MRTTTILWVMVVSGCGGGGTSVTPASVDGGTAFPLDGAAVPSTDLGFAENDLATGATDLASATRDLASATNDLATTTGATDLASATATDLALATNAADLAKADLSFVSSADLGPSCPTSPTAFDANLIAYVSDSDFLYGFEPPNLARVPRQGGMPQTIAADVAFAFSRGLQVDDGFVYWLRDNRVGTSENVIVYRVPKSGGVPAEIAHPLWISSYTMNDQQIFFTDDGFTISAFDKSGSDIRVVGSTNSDIIAMVAADGEEVYFTAFDGSHARLERIPVGGGVPTLVASWTSNSMSGTPGRGLGDAQFIYVFDFGKIIRINKSSGELVVLFDNTTQSAHLGELLVGMALDDHAVYWASQPYDSPQVVPAHYRLARVDKDGSNLRVLVDGGSYGSGLAVSGDSAYFSESPVQRICK